MAFKNNGEQNFKILKQQYTDDDSLTGLQMPNIPFISPEAIVSNSATITFNYPDDVAPTGGANDDIWYNPTADNLYKKVDGIWSLLTDRVPNVNYIAPVENLTDCPLPE